MRHQVSWRRCRLRHWKVYWWTSTRFAKGFFFKKHLYILKKFIKMKSDTEIWLVIVWNWTLNKFKLWLIFLIFCNSVSFVALVEKMLKQDRLLAPHFRYYVREMRILAYTQLLESYRSLTLQYMADAFGVTTDFIDRYFIILYFFLNPWNVCCNQLVCVLINFNFYQN